ncbi:MAG: hypothetical protein ACOCRK_10475, partial [bacterium]
MQRAEILQLLKIGKKISNQAYEAFKVDSYNHNKLLKRVDEITDIILDMLNIPTDTSAYYNYEDEDWYCRDKYYIIIYNNNLGYTDYTEEEVLDQLLWAK